MNKSLAFYILSTLVIIALCGAMEIGLFGIVLIAVLWFFVCLFAEHTISNAKKKKSGFYPKSFYQKCVKEGLINVTSEAEIQKAILVQKQMNYEKFGDAKKLFEEGKALLDEENRFKASATKKENRQKQAQSNIHKYKKSIKYAELIGREKRLAMLNDELAAAEKLQAESRAAMMQLTHGNLHASLEKEKDWAITGGLVQGIAGPAAGVAAALEVQEENKQIRKRNEERKKDYVKNNADTIVEAAKKDNRLNDKVASLRKKINETPLKRVSNTSAEEVFKKLKFGQIDYTISKSGLIRVTALVSSEIKYIYENVPAVVDGTLKGVLFQNEKEIGNALFVLPRNGVSDKFVNVTGICINANVDNETPIRVSFAPYHLWEIEK